MWSDSKYGFVHRRAPNQIWEICTDLGLDQRIRVTDLESLDPNTPRFIGKTGSKKNYPGLKKKVQCPFLLLMGIPKPASDRPGLSDSSNGSCSKIGLMSYFAYLKGHSNPGLTLSPANFWSFIRIENRSSALELYVSPLQSPLICFCGWVSNL